MKANQTAKAITLTEDEVETRKPDIHQVETENKQGKRKYTKKSVKKEEDKNTADTPITMGKDVKKKTSASKKVEAKVILQYQGNEIESKSLLERAKAEYLALGGKEKDIRSMDLYMKPEDNAVYYVINGVAYGKVVIFT